MARRRCEGDGVPRGLRERRTRPVRAARRDGRAPLANGVPAARAPRRRAVRGQRARRVLRHADGRRGAGRAAQGSRRQPDARRQLDARVRAVAARAHLGRRRARAPGGRRVAPRA